jgi:hypothetical protein
MKALCFIQTPRGLLGQRPWGAGACGKPHGGAAAAVAVAVAVLSACSPQFPRAQSPGAAGPQPKHKHKHPSTYHIATQGPRSPSGSPGPRSRSLVFKLLYRHNAQHRL